MIPKAAILFAIQNFLRGTDMQEDVIAAEAIEGELAGLAMKARMEGKQMRRIYSPSLGLMIYGVVDSTVPMLLEKTS